MKAFQLLLDLRGRSECLPIVAQLSFIHGFTDLILSWIARTMFVMFCRLAAIDNAFTRILELRFLRLRVFLPLLSHVSGYRM